MCGIVFRFLCIGYFFGGGCFFYLLFVVGVFSIGCFGVGCFVLLFDVFWCVWG